MKIKVAGAMYESIGRELADLIYQALRGVNIWSMQELIQILEHRGFDLAGREEKIELCHILNLLAHDGKVRPWFALQIGSELGFRLEIAFT